MSYFEFYNSVMEKGEIIFGTKVKFNSWMGTYNKKLGDLPVNLINSTDGLELIDNVLENFKKNK